MARQDDLKQAFGHMLYDVEHALVMYAYSFVQLPAVAIYDQAILSQISEVTNNCHIYLIGFLPEMEFVGARQDGRKLITSLSALGEVHDIEWPLPDGFELVEEGGYHYVATPASERCFPGPAQMMTALQRKTSNMNFDVQYIGQAYGQDGTRNAVDRLRKHETLQKISLKGIPAGFNLELLLLEIAPSNMLVTMLNPFAQNKTHGDERIEAGLNKLFGTDEPERIALFEASLIRYFRPKFNKEFKDSFPSTNMKVLRDCYDKDFSAVVAEICLDDLPYYLCSDAVNPLHYHIAKHDLHQKAERKAFFSGS